MKALDRLLKFGVGIEIQKNDKQACDYYENFQTNY